MKKVTHLDRFVLSGATDGSFLVHDVLNPTLRLIAALDTSNPVFETSTSKAAAAAAAKATATSGRSTTAAVAAAIPSAAPARNSALDQDDSNAVIQPDRHVDGALPASPSNAGNASPAAPTHAPAPLGVPVHPLSPASPVGSSSSWLDNMGVGSSNRRVAGVMRVMGRTAHPLTIDEINKLRPGLTGSTALARNRRKKLVFLETFGSFVVGGIAPEELKVLSNGQVMDVGTYRAFVQAGTGLD